MSGAPIGVFDSGVGGRTVARAIGAQLPARPPLHLGETVNAPYGPRPGAEVRPPAPTVLDQPAAAGVKLLVIAGNSAGAACLRDARERYDVPVVEVIVPTTCRAVAATRSGRVGVVGTVATNTSRAYEDAFSAASGTELVSVACPAFGAFVVEGITSGRELLGLTEAYRAPLQEADVDTVILGCTHFPLLTGVIGLVPGEGVTPVRSAQGTAEATDRVLARRVPARDGRFRDPDLPPPAHRLPAPGAPAASRTRQPRQTRPTRQTRRTRSIRQTCQARQVVAR
ncbi:glutamate racemase [Frankia sp. CcI49]|uniref:glutamate racemase n=1 Tax=Frankia sp. CcI49 TaxID=1745382 RepID=UPI0009784C6E|nr:glutamate racemase [Frankia sp. CcI49]